MILVTGAAGFIGREVCRQLIASGEQVIGLDKNATDARQAQNLQGIALTELIHADLLDLDLRALLGRVKGVVHLAGSPGVQTSWSTGFRTHLDNNVLATQRLAEAMLDVPVQRMVVASSSSVYGNIGGDSAANEDFPVAPMSPYGASKAAMEHVVSAYVHRGLDIVPLRYFTVFGPHQRPDMAMNLMIQAQLGAKPFTLRGDGSQRRNFTYVGDAAGATIAALTSTNKSLKPGTCFNIGGQETVSVTEVLQLLSALHGEPVPINEVAPVPGDPTRTAADTSRAAELLGWSPQVSLREGLAAQLAWQTEASEVGVTPPSLAPASIDTANRTPQMASPTIGSIPFESPSGISL